MKSNGNQLARNDQMKQAKFPNENARIGRMRAFTFMDMVATLAVIGLIGVMILPAFGRTTSSGAIAQCLNNLRQLGAAWSMYSSDAQGDLIECHPWKSLGFSRQAGVANPYSWAPGYAGSANIATYGSVPLHSSTNPMGLTISVFHKYYKNVDLMSCASDKRMIDGNPIVRSYAMNSWMNGNAYNNGFRFFTKQEHVIRPATTFLMMDEDAVTLDDGMFITFMDSRGYVNVPARRHNNGYAMNFADGRGEIYKLKDAVNITVSTAPGSPGVPLSGTSEDYRYHTNITTHPIAASEN